MLTGIHEEPGHEKLEPADAAARFSRDPASVKVALPDFMRAFGLTPDEMLDELRSGRLVAEGARDDAGGYHSIAISGSEVLRWMVANNRRFA